MYADAEDLSARMKNTRDLPPVILFIRDRKSDKSSLTFSPAHLLYPVQQSKCPPQKQQQNSLTQHSSPKGEMIMKAIKKTALMTALLLSLAAFASCGSTATNTPAQTGADSVSTGADTNSTVTIAGQELPETAMLAKPEGGKQITDEAERLEIQHKIFVANSKDSIFKNHTSMSLTLDDNYKHPNPFGQFFYSKSGCSYMRESDYCQYSKDREVLQWCGIGSYSPFPVYVAELSENYDGIMYWYISDDEDEFFDPAHEHFTDVLIKDGVIWQYTELDETGSKDYIESMMDGTYNGETVSNLIRADAETYEYIDSIYYATKDGKTGLMGTHTMEYDQPEPAEVTEHLAHFENTGDKTATITYTANPGKDNEISKTLTVPQYTTVTFYSKDIPDADLFLDPECTKSASGMWDGVSDKEYYVIPHKN